MATGTPVTSTTLYPAYTTKAAFLLDLGQNLDRPDKLQEIMYRLGNSDTSSWADPTVTAQDSGVI